MIFERAARREFAQAAAGISVALLAILTSTNLIRLLKEAAGGRIAPEAVASLLGFAALNFMPVLLSLTLFVAVLLSLSRVYRDSEMVVWFAAGVPLTAGFFAKMISFVHVINTGLYLDWMLPVMIVCAASGFYYYFKVIRSMYWDKPAENAEPVQVPAISGVMLAAFSIFIVLGGLMPLFLNPIR